MQFRSQEEILYKCRLLEGWAQLLVARGFSDAFPSRSFDRVWHHVYRSYTLLCNFFLQTDLISPDRDAKGQYYYLKETNQGPRSSEPFKSTFKLHRFLVIRYIIIISFNVCEEIIRHFLFILSLLVMTSTIRTVAMFLSVVGRNRTLYIRHVIYIRSKYLMPNSNISLVIALKSKAKENFHMVAILLFYILLGNCFNKMCIFFEDLLPYIFPRLPNSVALLTLDFAHADIIFIQIFVKISQRVKPLNGGTHRHIRRKYGGLISLLSFFEGREVG
jgi:hypothetical protein